jgi:hypothetical protein
VVNGGGGGTVEIRGGFRTLIGCLAAVANAASSIRDSLIAGRVSRPSPLSVVPAF